jgi:hypothetical protein
MPLYIAHYASHCQLYSYGVFGYNPYQMVAQLQSAI